MVFKILGASTTFHGIDYNDNKQKQGKARLIHVQNFGYLQQGKLLGIATDFKKYLEKFSSTNLRTKHKQFHAILSCKGAEKSNEELKTAAIKLMSELGYDKTPLLIYSHDDTKNRHIHIVTSRVNENGKKINHMFERIRANKILNKEINRNPELEFKEKLKEISKYSISSTSQFQLLFELNNYTTKKNADNIEFYKHGQSIGKVPVAEIERQISFFKKDKNSKIKAVIYKFKNQFSAELKLQTKTDGYTTKKAILESDLTKALKSKMGYEFVFFTGDQKGTQNNNAVKPYGYVIIDHKNKAVHKGSDIIKLDNLLSINKADKVENKVSSSNKEIDNTYYTSNELYNVNEATKEYSKEDNTINELVQEIGDSLEKQVKEADYNKGKGANKKGKRKFY